MNLTVQALFEANEEALKLRWLQPAGAERLIHDDDNLSHEPADIVGHLNLIHPERIHVYGYPESNYFRRLGETRKDGTLREILSGRSPAIIVADGLPEPRTIVALSREAGVPVIASPVPAARVIDTLREWLSRAMAAHTSMHGVFMDVLGMGVMISGESGLGKSELALELISRGHGLVADDVVEFTRIGPQAIEGKCPPILRNLLEVRGLGLLDIRTIFGETAVRRHMRLKLIVHMIRRSTMDSDYQRLPLEALTQDVLGVPVRKMVIPVAAGRNLAVLTEAAVRSTVLQLRGIDTTAEFIQRQRRLIESHGGE
jgi:HPr kinase/phosphorylase